ncbi:uncharacterized proline-rich protein-like [Bacillus rossius redtenbacheri]|uniref:uncharacterized proline-rich protein-like n=1 Tax=Bacillus rossius redtenbacheri TaxID=93214 RepID=UPI002FDC8248
MKVLVVLLMCGLAVTSCLGSDDSTPGPYPPWPPPGVVWPPVKPAPMPVPQPAPMPVPRPPPIPPAQMPVPVIPQHPKPPPTWKFRRSLQD